MPSSDLLNFNQQFEQILAVLEQTPWLILRIKQLNHLHTLLEDSLAKTQQLPFKMELNGMAQMIAIEIISEPGALEGLNPKHLELFYQKFHLGLERNTCQEFEYLIIESWFKTGSGKELENFLGQCQWYMQMEGQSEIVAAINLPELQHGFLKMHALQLPDALIQRLKHKLEAAFFSSARTVILPASHQQLAKKCLSDLQADFPLRDLKLVFLSHINELEAHREIFFYQRRKVSRRVVELQQ